MYEFLSFQKFLMLNIEDCMKTLKKTRIQNTHLTKHKKTYSVMELYNCTRPLLLITCLESFLKKSK